MAEADKLGLNVVGNATFTTDSQNDFNVQLTQAKQAEADLLFLPIYYEPASLILSQAKAMGYAPKFFGVDGMDGILTMKNFDPALAEGVMLLTPFNADDEDEATQSDGAGITWDATGAVSKSPKGMVIQNGAYAGMD